MRYLKICALSILLFLNSCSKKECASTERPTLLVSIAPYQMLVQKIAGDDFEVTAVVPPNANPHIYEPTSKQVAELKKGAVWFQIGEPFEKKIAGHLNAKQIDLRHGASMIEAETHHCSGCGIDHLDRHIWLSPKQAMLQADQIAEALKELYPQQSAHLEKRRLALKEELSELDREIADAIQGLASKTFLVSHPAFAYFCRDYGLHQLSVEFEGKDPRPKDLEALYKKAIADGATVAICLPQHNNKGAQLIAEKMHIPVRMIDPYSAHYFETMRALAAVIKDPYQNHE